ncbi:hypothetical protein KY290_005501 [Solanum tuberosum]|uniref:Chitin-binding type-1 domain-containing protein n=1 Tax=Solanum tuberosum TaxID=4113 RepID=A0ABQ7WEC0_SOLTU|nr:hypothetical protein KY289_005888 [Solanum tuberosum]KAH0779074.1 hypothetical protein KY290_005501 [Solanum tuberosum]
MANKKAGGALCASGLCCSKFGWCGDTNDYCGPGGGPDPGPSGDLDCPGGSGPGPSGDLDGVISNSIFDQMLNHRNNNACQGKGSFPRFGTTGDINACKRELRLSLPKHLIKLLADDLQHQIDHTHGRTASLENSF